MTTFMKVRLIKDLTQYDSKLTVGVEGVAHMNEVSFSDWEEPLYVVYIKGAKPLPIGMNALEILDKGFWKERERDIKQAVSIEYNIGPRGGFKFMRIISINRKRETRIYTTTVKHEAQKLKEMAKLHNKVITENCINKRLEV